VDLEGLGIGDVHPTEDGDAPGHAFDIETKDRTYILSATSANEMDKWIKAVRQSICIKREVDNEVFVNSTYS
jgi:site-specific recombinase XerD